MSTSPAIRFTSAHEPGGGGWTTLLRLVEPVLEYASVCNGGTPHGGRWECAEANVWAFSDGAMRLSAELSIMPMRVEGGARLLRCRATSLQSVCIRECAIVLEATCAEPPRIIDKCLRWRELRDTSMSCEWTPLVVGWRDEGGHLMELRAAGGAPPARLSWCRGKLRIRVELDAAALHPRWHFVNGRQLSNASPVQPAGWEATVPFLLRTVDDLAPAPVVAGRFPAGREAAFTISDHCDFDRTDTLRLFLEGGRGGRCGRGWLGRGLRLTKGVFTIESSTASHATTPTLQNPGYRALVRRLHDEGSEIAPHGVNERGVVAPDCFRAALDQITSVFSPRTWIDHGSTLDYCYSMGGATNPGYRLLAELRARGVTTLWAYHDVPVSAVASLNLLAPSGSDFPRVVLQMSRHIKHGEHLVAAHYGRSALLERTAGRVQERIGRVLTTARRHYVTRTDAGWGPLRAAASIPWALLTQPSRRHKCESVDATATRVPFTRDEVILMAPTIYPERAVPLSQLVADDILLFASMEVLHTEDVYTGEALDRLIAERGLHIAHSYLLNRLPYIAGIFAAPEREALSALWLEMLQALGDAIAEGRLWNPPVGELAEWARRWQRVTVLPVSKHMVEICNPHVERVRDFTVLLPVAVDARAVRWDGANPAGSRTWGSWLSVWGDLPSERSTIVRWD
jgi:hypothetical protein